MRQVGLIGDHGDLPCVRFQPDPQHRRAQNLGADPEGILDSMGLAYFGRDQGEPDDPRLPRGSPT